MIYAVEIPKRYSITTGGYYTNKSNFVSGSELLDIDSKRVLLSLSWGGGIFEQASADIQIFEPIPAIKPMPSFGGIWEIKVDGRTVFRGYADNVKKDRTLGGNVFTFTLKSVLSSWDVLLTNTSFGGVSTTASVKLDPPTVGKYLEYLIDTVQSTQIPYGVPYYGNYPTNNTPIDELYEDGVISVTNSTYLAEIQKVCQNLGYVIFAEPYGYIRIIDPLNPPLDSVIYTASAHPELNLEANFVIKMSSIPATVLVADDILQVGVAYGHKEASAPHDDTNFNITKLNNIVFAVTTGIKQNKLPDIAKQIYDISRKASQVLTFKVAMILQANFVLGYPIIWTDSMGNTGKYIISKYTTNITPQELYTEIEAYVA